MLHQERLRFAFTISPSAAALATNLGGSSRCWISDLLREIRTLLSWTVNLTRINSFYLTVSLLVVTVSLYHRVLQSVWNWVCRLCIMAYHLLRRVYLLYILWVNRHA